MITNQIHTRFLYRQILLQFIIIIVKMIKKVQHLNSEEIIVCIYRIHI